MPNGKERRPICIFCLGYCIIPKQIMERKMSGEDTEIIMIIPNEWKQANGKQKRNAIYVYTTEF
jgi:hypothetical protein